MRSDTSVLTSSLTENFRGADRDYVIRIIHTICCLAGDPEFLGHFRTRSKSSLAAAVERHDTARLFEWLVAALSYQGIADAVARDYTQRHGRASWTDFEVGLARHPSCPKLKSYWQFENCRYLKNAESCSEPAHIAACPLPTLPLRNGHLNQMAFSLFLFIRDVAGSDLVAWIDAQLDTADNKVAPDRLEAMIAGLLEPMRCIYGVSDKVLSMALADLLLAAGQHRPCWAEVGAQMIAVDRLVHNFLHRTGVLRRLSAEHAYGPGCYRADGCVGIIDHGV